METITLQYNPNSAFATALAALLHDAKDVSVMRNPTIKSPRTNRRGTLEKAIQEEKEGKVNTYANVDELFAKLGI